MNINNKEIQFKGKEKKVTGSKIENRLFIKLNII